MNMRIRHAVAATLLCAAAGTASAFDITTYTGTPLYVGGSTAIDNALKAYFEEIADGNSPCVTNDHTNNPIDVYTGTLTGVKFFAVACTAKAAVGSVADANKHIVFIKEDNGGSINGVQGVGLPASGGVTLSFPALSGLNSTNCTNVDTPATTVVAEFNAHACASGYSALATPIQANLGFADVEASLFSLDTSTAGLDLVGAPTIDIVFAPAVSLGLYHALQSSQGLTQDDLTADIPSLPTSTLSSIYTGQILQWSGIQGTGTHGTVGAQTSIQFGTSGGTGHEFNSGNPGNPASQKIYMCRRDNGSGTEKTSEIVFGNLDCTSGNVAFRSSGTGDALGNSWTQPAGLTGSGAAANTFAGNGTGAVLNCLQGMDQLGAYAIGFASVDNGWGSKGSTNGSGVGSQDFRYIKVDGVVPSIENAASGSYRYWAQSTDYVPGSQPGHTNVASGDAGLVLTYVTSSSTGIGVSGAIGALDTNNEWTQGPTWDGGVLGIPGNVGNTPVTAASNTATFRLNPVNDFIKASGGNDNCQSPIVAPGAQIGAAGSISWAGP
jgi:hypothetical protein